MNYNANCPIGSDTAEAPWNDQDVPEKKFDMLISQTLSKSTKVLTDSYYPEYDEESKEMVPDTTYIDWEEEYHDNDHYTPIQLIALFKRHLEMEIERGEVREEYNRHLIEECDDWLEDETTYMEN